MNVPVLDHGFVRLESFSASDESVVRAARVSFAKQDEEVDWEKDEGLVNFLMREHHGTPFEHNFFCFHVKLPLFVVREWQRHRIGWSYNEWSGRYSKLEPEFYVPDYVRTQTGKPGAYRFEAVDPDIGRDTRRAIRNNFAEAFMRYELMLSDGVAKEVARMVLPLNTYTQMYASCNARSLMHFIALRNSEQAQYEIRRYADSLEGIFSDYMPVTYKAFMDNGRVAP